MEKENEVFLKNSENKIADEKEMADTQDGEIGNGDRSVEKEDGPVLLTDKKSVDDGVFIWEAPEFEHLEKSTTWYWGSMIVAIILMTIALWQKNFLFAVFIMIAELAIFMLAGEKPKTWEFTIDDKGVTIENHKMYKYATITMYDIHEFSDEYHELVLRTTSKVHHYIKIFIHVEDEERIVELLEKRVHRGEIEVSFIEFFERLIGF